MILLTTSLKCGSCGKVIGASLLTNPERRDSERSDQLAGLMKLAREHSCVESPPLPKARA